MKPSRTSRTRCSAAVITVGRVTRAVARASYSDPLPLEDDRTADDEP